ncbi:MAG: dihydrofolate reductase family protein [Solirubrobacterales bacterium]
MGKIGVFNHLTLDGVMQGPAAPDEDTRGGFDKGGWAAGRDDEVLGRKIGAGMSGSGALLLGRRTYEHFYSFWPHQTDNPFTEVLNRSTKYVASRALSEPLPWENSVLLGDDVPASVAEVKANEDKDVVILGSGELVQSLLPHGLIDEYILLIHPVVLGKGRRLFAEGVVPVDLELAEAIPTTTGVVIATYRAA